MDKGADVPTTTQDVVNLNIRVNCMLLSMLPSFKELTCYRTVPRTSVRY